MSRSVRDLRELICVSRLTIRDSDDDVPFSDSDDLDTGGDTAVNNPLISSGTDSRQSSAQSMKGRHSRDVVSPDSGIGTNGRPASPINGQDSLSEFTPSVLVHTKLSSEPVVGGMRRKKKRKLKPVERVSHQQYPRRAGELPSLPGSIQATSSRPSSSSSEDNIKFGISNLRIEDRPLELGEPTSLKKGNFDDMLMYLDATLISEWLAQSNSNVTDLTSWCHSGENFVQFAHFWLSEFPDLQKQEIYKMEYSIVLDQLGFAFQAGISCEQVKRKDLVKFLDAVFREYPGKLLSSKGPHLFLDHLDVLTSERKSSYKSLLSDVKVSTRIKQHAQWCLAVRSFALVSIWTAVVNFYRRLVPTSNQLSTPLSAIGTIDPIPTRMEQSIRNGFCDVINYLLHTERISANFKDSHQRSLLFSAVMHSQSKVLEYLLMQTEAVKDVNHPADTGNCPLHAAANSGDQQCVKILIQSPEINLNQTNPQCDDATPLHLATLHGYFEVVEMLIRAGADVNMKMGQMTLYDIARDFDHNKILELLNDQKK